MLLFAMCLAVTFCMFSCAPTVKKEIGSLDLKYNYTESDISKTGLSIAIVSPQISGKQIAPQTNTSNPLVQFLAAQSGQCFVEDFNTNFHMNYLDRVKKSFENSFQEIVTKKGFNFTGPFSTFDDMTYNEKKEGYLALVPILDISIDKKNTNISSSPITHIYTESGVIQIGGEFKIDFIEPLTKEKIMSRRINLSDFGIEVAYKKEIKQPSGLIGNVIAAQQEIEDSTDKALTDALNIFYKKSLEKVVKYLSTDEIVSYKEQINNLKNLKKF